MKKKKWNRVLSGLLVMVMAILFLSGCGEKRAEKGGVLFRLQQAHEVQDRLLRHEA